MFKKILIANDGSEGAKRALLTAIDLAKGCEAELHSISVEEELPKYAATLGEVIEAKRESNGYFHKVNEEARRAASERGVTLQTHIVPGHEVGTIVQFAKDRQFDLLVIGHKGHSRLWKLHMGSTADKIADHAPCSLLIVQ